jgi:hypothetical protein
MSVRLCRARSCAARRMAIWDCWTSLIFYSVCVAAFIRREGSLNNPARLHEYPDKELEHRWNDFLRRADFPAHYVAPEYFLEPFFRRKRPFAVLAWQDDEIVGALTGVHEDGQVVSGLLSRPQCCVDKSADPSVVANRLVEGLLAEADSEPVITLFTWTPIGDFFGSGFRCAKQEGVVMLDLRRGPEALLKDFSSNRRTNVRRALKQGVEVALATTKEDLRAYYEIYTHWCARKNIPPVSYETSEEAFSLRSRRLFLARYSGRVIAGVSVRLHPTGMIEYAANSSYEQDQKLKPNDLLHWHVIQWGCREGFTRYNLCGAHLFLRKMGGTIQPIYRYRLDRTWLRRHELEESLRRAGRAIFDAVPERLRMQVKRALKRET